MPKLAAARPIASSCPVDSDGGEPGRDAVVSGLGGDEADGGGVTAGAGGAEVGAGAVGGGFTGGRTVGWGVVRLSRGAEESGEVGAIGVAGSGETGVTWGSGVGTEGVVRADGELLWCGYCEPEAAAITPDLGP